MKQFYPFLLFLTLSLSAQRTNVWYFGDHAGIDFNSGSPVAISNGALYTIEGSASMCGTNGQLLFYTNGGDYGPTYPGGVWNRNHQLMPNGDLTSMNGCASTYQSALIVPDPGDTNKYYLFTLDCLENNLVGGFRFNVIDMTLDGGLGDLIVKDSLICDSALECMDAVSDKTSQGYWIVTHKSHYNGSFRAFHIGAGGISAPVISTVGPTIAWTNAGAIKIACNGEKLAWASLNGMSVFDFDNATGIVSNESVLPNMSFACSFSPDCHYLYSGDANTAYIYQYDMFAGNIAASTDTITSVSGLWYNMQIGPDEKIYVADFSNQLSVINNPNNPAALANFVPHQLTLTGNSLFSLPNFVADLTHDCTPAVDAITSHPIQNPSLSIGPNPTNDRLYVWGIPDGTDQVVITDIFGRTVIALQPTHHDQMELDLSGISSGIYFISVYQNNNRIYCEKLIKE